MKRQKTEARQSNGRRRGGGARRGGSLQEAVEMIPSWPTEQDIREHAYEIYRARGGGPGDSDADWFEAERSLRERKR